MAVSKTDNDSSETYRLLWLDANVNNEENLAAQEQIRATNYLETFDDEKECQQSIKQIPEEDRILLIVSGRMGRDVVPTIHEIQKLSAVYVYCGNQKEHEKWAKQFEKVKIVTVHLDALIRAIQIDHKQRMKEEESLLMSIFSGSAGSSSTGLDGQFVYFQILIDVLLRIKPNKEDRLELISLCEKLYQNNTAELSFLKEFAKNYSSSKAIWWYTRESLIYKMLNRALRTQDIHVLFLFRFFINDIYRQLHDNQLQSKVQVYRGQVMSTTELGKIEKSVGDIISMNSFFSTSRDPDVAISFLKSSAKPSHGHLERVLFKIDADSRVSSTKPFADIGKFSAIQGENEVLFMLGSTFRLHEVQRCQDVDTEWSTVRMSLCGDENYELHELYKHMKKQYGTGETNLLSFGNVLRSMGKYDLAESYCRRFLHELATNHPLNGDAYYGLGLVAQAQGKFDKSLELYQKALKILLQTRPSDYIIIGNIYNAIGEAYLEKDGHNQALESFKQAVALFEQAHDENHVDMALFHDNIGTSYQNQKNYPDALVSYAKSLIIRQKHLPANSPDLAKSFNNVGIVRLRLGQPDLALANFKRSLDIRLKALPDKHPDIGMSYKKLGDAYESKGQFERALEAFEKACNIYDGVLSPDHPDVVTIREDIQRVSNKLEQ